MKKDKIAVGVLVGVLALLAIVSAALGNRKASPAQISTERTAAVVQVAPGSATASTPLVTTALPEASPVALPEENVNGLRVQLMDGAKVDHEAVISAMRYVKARWEVDTTRPYPGCDLAALKDIATGSEKTLLDDDMRLWQKPRSMDAKEYADSAKAKYHEGVEFKTGWFRQSSQETKVTLAVKITTTAENQKTSSEEKLAQLTLQSDGKKWRVAKLDEHPQSP